MLKRISIEQANSIMLETIKPILEQEEVFVLDSLSRIISTDIYATMDQPPFPRSPIDGYACKAEDIKNASPKHPISLKVIADISAGDYFIGSLQKGEAIRIMTGAPIPSDCDCCIRQEDTDYGEDRVCIYQSHVEYQNYCFQGEDFKKGTLLIRKNTKLGYIELGVLASTGIDKVMVYRTPKIALLTTGDELVNPSKELPLGKIYNSNQYLLHARLKELGITPYLVEHLTDHPQVVANRMQQIIDEVDLIITTGGVSVGKKDIFHEALPLANAKQIFWKVQVKPGGPTLFSTLKEKPIISLSGNPFGALVNFEILVHPMLAKLTRNNTLVLKERKAILENNFTKASIGRRIIRAVYQDGKVSLPKKHASGILSSATGCNCLVDIKAGSKGLQKGDEVSIWLL